MAAARRFHVLVDAIETAAARPGRGHRADLLIERIAETGSTSTDLLDRAALVPVVTDGPDVPRIAPARIGAVWLIADHQTGGRGRRGRRWRSDPDASLAASLALEAPLPSEPGALTLIAGAAVARTLTTFGARPWLKWPNDVYLRDATGGLSKAGGILCESRVIGAASPGGPRATWRLVIGCGLNLFPRVDGPAAADDGAVAGPPPGHLFEHADPLLRERLESALGIALANAVHAALRDGPAAGLADWAGFDVLADQPVAIHGTDGVHQAVARGIDAAGRLLVSGAADPGRCRALVAEEVSIRRLRE